MREKLSEIALDPLFQSRYKPPFNYFTNPDAGEILSNEVSCSFENIPSMIDIINRASSRDQVIEELMNIPDDQVSDSAREHDLIFTTRNEFVSTGAKRNVCQKLYDKLTGAVFLREYESKDYIEIPIAEIHSPHTANSRTTYNWTTEVNTTTNFKVEFVGCSVGGGASIKIKTKESITSEGKCLYVSKLCLMKVECWKTKRGKIVYVPRLVAISNGLQAKPLPLSAPYHFCSQKIEKVRKVVRSFSSNPAYYAHCLPFSLPKAAPATEEASIREGLIIDIKSNMSFEAMEKAASFDIRVKSTVTNEFGYEINLEGGHDYLGFYRGFTSSAYMWAWRQNGMG